MLCVGIDCASDHHDVCLTNVSAQTLAAFRITHGSQGFECLHRVTNEHQPEPQEVLVALETTRGLLIHDLLRSEYTVYAINPKAISRYKSIPALNCMNVSQVVEAIGDLSMVGRDGLRDSQCTLGQGDDFFALSLVETESSEVAQKGGEFDALREFFPNCQCSPVEGFGFAESPWGVVESGQFV